MEGFHNRGQGDIDDACVQRGHEGADGRRDHGEPFVFKATDHRCAAFLAEYGSAGVTGSECPVTQVLAAAYRIPRNSDKDELDLADTGAGRLPAALAGGENLSGLTILHDSPTSYPVAALCEGICDLLIAQRVRRILVRYQLDYHISYRVG